MSERVKALLFLIGSFLFSVGGIITALPTIPALWETPAGVGGLCLSLGGVILGFVGKGWNAMKNGGS